VWRRDHPESNQAGLRHTSKIHLDDIHIRYFPQVLKRDKAYYSVKKLGFFNPSCQSAPLNEKKLFARQILIRVKTEGVVK
jgi:hypothetical protein